MKKEEYAIINAIVESVEIGVEPDNTPSVTVVFKKSSTLKFDETYKRCFCVASRSARNEAESIGLKVLALAWVMDHCFGLRNLEGQIARIKYHEEGNVMAIGHPIQERWLDRESEPELVYPFYSGVPKRK